MKKINSSNKIMNESNEFRIYLSFVVWYPKCGTKYGLHTAYNLCQNLQNVTSVFNRCNYRRLTALLMHYSIALMSIEEVAYRFVSAALLVSKNTSKSTLITLHQMFRVRASFRTKWSRTCVYNGLSDCFCFNKVTNKSKF